MAKKKKKIVIKIGRKVPKGRSPHLPTRSHGSKKKRSRNRRKRETKKELENLP